MGKLGLLVFALVVASCAHKGSSANESFDEQIRRTTQPIPADLREQVERSERIGAQLYAFDSVAWVATDALREGGDRKELGIGGYIVLPEGDASGPTGPWQTIFYSADEPRKVLVRVRVTDGQKPTVDVLQPPEDPVRGVDDLIRARETAIHSLARVDQPLNPVILPGSVVGASGILVYLLAGTTVPKLVVFGRHHRILISEDGTKVVRSEPLSKTALVMPLEPPDADPGFTPEALIVTHLVSSTPLETHVLASLQHHVRVLVATDRGDWLVDGRRITYLGPRAP